MRHFKQYSSHITAEVHQKSNPYHWCDKRLLYCVVQQTPILQTVVCVTGILLRGQQYSTIYKGIRNYSHQENMVTKQCLTVPHIKYPGANKSVSFCG